MCNWTSARMDLPSAMLRPRDPRVASSARSHCVTSHSMDSPGATSAVNFSFHFKGLRLVITHQFSGPMITCRKTTYAAAPHEFLRSRGNLWISPDDQAKPSHAVPESALIVAVLLSPAVLDVRCEAFREEQPARGGRG